MIPFNKPFIAGKELEYIKEAVESGKISGDGAFTIKCQNFFEEKYGFKKALLTTSCTDALEMAAILMDIQPGDEVIVPSFTFVSTANAFVLRGAKVVFADIDAHTLNIDHNKLEPLINSKTKALVIVHYAGVACDMDAIMDIVGSHNLYLVEDTALAIDSYYKGKPLGTFGQFATYSFHETKNIICGEGGALMLNDERFVQRAEIIREKGTNRSQFFRGEASKYEWVDIGSSFLPSEILAAYLYAQLENLDRIQEKRKRLWDNYFNYLQDLSAQYGIGLPQIPGYASQNGQMFYILCQSMDQRGKLIEFLKERGIKAVFHYLPLHLSPFYKNKHDGRKLAVTEKISDTILRLPLFFGMTEDEQGHICESLLKFFT